MKNYDNKTKCETKDRGYKKIKKCLIIYLKKYNIQLNSPTRLIICSILEMYPILSY